MSRIHINFVEMLNNDHEAIYEVFTPDFSVTGTEVESIGQVVIDLGKRTFKFNPRLDLLEIIYPPEYFLEHSFQESDSIAENENYYYTAWSYYIFKKACEIIQKIAPKV